MQQRPLLNRRKGDSHSSVSCFEISIHSKTILLYMNDYRTWNKQNLTEMTKSLIHCFTTKKLKRVQSRKTMWTLKTIQHIFMFFFLNIYKTKAQATFRKWTCANKKRKKKMQNGSISLRPLSTPPPPLVSFCFYWCCWRRNKFTLLVYCYGFGRSYGYQKPHWLQ